MPVSFRPSLSRGLCLGLLALLATLPALAQTPVTLQLRWLHQFQFAGYYAALHKGFYQEAGLDVTLKEGGPGISPLDEVLAGRAQFGIANAGLVNAFLNGKPVLMLAPIFQHSPSVLLVRGRKADTPADLAGAGPVLLLGNDEDVELKAMFVNEGIPLERVQFVTEGRHLDDLVQGRVVALNAYLSNEPFLLQQQGIPHRVLRPQTYGMDFYSDVLFSTRDMERQSPETVAAFRQASLRGWEYALANPEEIIELILRRYNSQGKSREHLAFEAKVLKELITPELVQIGHSNPGRWQHIADTFARFGMNPDARDLDGFFYTPDRPRDYGWLKGLAVLLGLGALLLAFRSLVLTKANRRLTQEIEARTAAQLALEAAHHKLARFAGIIDEHVMITRTDREGRIVEVTRAFCRQTGFEPAQLIGQPLLQLFDKKVLGSNKLPETLQAGQFWQGEIKTIRRDGSYFWADVSISPVKDDDGSLVEMTAFHVDATARKTIEQLSRLDGLTGLLNRRTFLAEAARILQTSPSPWVCAAMIDADFFKRINDTWGHLTGDRALQGIAREITALQQECGALTGRFGGEEFVILFSAQNILEPLPLLESFMERIRALRIPSQEGEISLTVSIGLEGLPTRGAVLEELLNRADQALYQAKYQGRDRICLGQTLTTFRTTSDRA
ncbi:ABC transporter substrate-binding protein [Azovibrio restrictus]|uniref:ABC transporter substrate-binding protein n=1 Tax=Azovibrio restrictus TaxID=146938 RepID=UPI0026F24539|nr:ABC transporter substrate-binding protein [Azovibrio restrictus]